jgi:pyridoxamine 5'-phosphate oxidase
MALSDERKEYHRATLELSDVSGDPLGTIASWIEEARALGGLEPTAMTLSTVDADGAPSGRVVLCKGIDHDGLRFFTSYESRKGRALAADARAAVTFWWPVLERQARVEGVVERVARDESERYFRSRPRGSQLAALASRQSEPIADRELLEAEVARLSLAHPDEVPTPATWGGYLLRPREIELWQGRPSRLHDRLRFRQVDGVWRGERLSP